MFRRTARIVWTKIFLSDLLEAAGAVAAAAGLLNGVKAKYITSPDPITPTTLLADVDVAALGAAGSVLAWSAPVNLAGNRVALKDEIEHVAGAAPTAENITGVIIVNAGGTVLLGGYKFDEVVPIAAEGDAISVDILAALPCTWETGVAEAAA